MKRQKTIYPIFLPHAGCPFQCVYCNQHAVTSTRQAQYSEESFTAYFLEQLRGLADHARDTSIPGEIAFYGGTFTALPVEVLRILLEAATWWVERGVFTGIRFSTRPDGVTPEICSLLRHYPIETVELGVQSLSNEVLLASCRGYTSDTAIRSALMVKEHGWALGIQMMPGLPGDTRERFLSSISKTVALQPDLVRLYPTLVLENTVLATWYRQGSYRPLSLDEALGWCAPAYDKLIHANIPLARAGLHSDPRIEKPGTIVAGPYHPAFGYLLRVYWWRGRVDEGLRTLRRPICGTKLVLKVPHRLVSEVIGPRQVNISHWKRDWHLESVRVEGEDEHPGGYFVLHWE